MLEIVDPADSRAVRNMDNVLAWCDLMINQKRAREAVAKYAHPDYIQHNPLIPDGADALAGYFETLTTQRKLARLVVHRVIAAGDFVLTHGQFLNLFSDDPEDSGIAVVDIYRMDEQGRAVEHWDVLQLVGDPKSDAAPWTGSRVAALNSNGLI